MTNIYIRDDDGCAELKVEGHSGYAASGSDIVCSAISILCFTLLSALMERDDRRMNLKYQQKDGYFYLSFSHWNNESLKAIFYAVCNGFQLVAEQYNNYVSLRFFSNRGEILNKDVQQ